MTAHRLNRLVAAGSGRCLAVAMDHGMPGSTALLEGIEDMAAAVDRVAGAGPDAILLGPGQAELLQARRGRERPALVLRLDVPDVYAGALPQEPVAQMIEDPVGLAVRLDAAAVVLNLHDMPDKPSLRRTSLQNLMALRSACDRAGMPVMVETVAEPPLGEAAGPIDAERLIGLVRQAVEMGADVIKADPPADQDDFARLVRVARVPVFVRGGGRVEPRRLLELTQQVLAGGGAGLVYGRNVIQHPDPAAMTRALAALVHRGASADEAAAELAA